MFIDRLTKPGDLILDPFCGGGTVPETCIKLGRRWIAFEIDPTVAERTMAYVASIQRPLPVVNETMVQGGIVDGE